MNRRGFLAAIGGAVGAFALDPERALWTPGKKLISIPKPAVWHPMIGHTIMFRVPEMSWPVDMYVESYWRSVTLETNEMCEEYTKNPKRFLDKIRNPISTSVPYADTKQRGSIDS